MKVYVLTMKVNYGWGTRFENYDQTVGRRVFSSRILAETAGKAFNKDIRSHSSYTIETMDVEESV